ncbi:helix-turn-helix domain-containing protein [Mesorhizobium sp. CC13]|uniref:helix-turn-helix domain-containing protein n=1 Tax=Mesorhizobium sp. CC13 TaxID=3029194 RepID=UPI0032671A6A
MRRTVSNARVRLQERGRLPPSLWPVAEASQYLAGSFLEVTIGQKVRSCRRQRGITLAERARAAGLSLGMMSKIEIRTISASLSTLQALSQALVIPLTALFRTSDAGRQDPPFARAGMRERMEPGASRSSHHENLLSYLG